MTAAHFSRHAKSYSQVVAPLFEPVHRYIERLVAGSRPGCRALDIGCGDGRLVRTLGRRGVDAIGCDAAAGMPRRVGTGRQPFVTADAHLLPFPSGVADVVICCLSLQFFSDQPRALSELRRVCADDGWVILAVPASAEPVSGMLSRASLALRDRQTVTVDLTTGGPQELAMFLTVARSGPDICRTLDDEEAEAAAELLASRGGQNRSLRCVILQTEPIADADTL